MNTKRLVKIALAAALTAVCAWITIKLPAISFTMQIFAVYLSALLLGPLDGLIATAVYLLLGAAGLPVFSGFGAGLGTLAGPTGGYLVGFLLIPVCLFLHARFNKPWSLVLSCVLGLAACYAFGTAWFVILTGKGLVPALTACVVPFIIPDAVKITLAWLISTRVKKYVE